MEHAVGEIITLQDGGKVEVVEGIGRSCEGCICSKFKHCVGACCLDTDRSDHKNVIYKEIKEK